MLFDMTIGLEDYAPHRTVVTWANTLGVEAIKSFGMQNIKGLEEIEALLENDSALGGSKVEGVVMKNYSRWGKDGKALMGKLVRPSFREQAPVTFKKNNPNVKDKIHALAASFATPARWNKSVQRLDEEGKLEHSPRDIGPLIKAIMADVEEEEEERVNEMLFKWAWPQMRRVVMRGFPEWYKEELVRTQFKE